MIRTGQIYTAQGATIRGLVPFCAAERKLWAFATFLRAVIFAIPIGVTYIERDEWMQGVRDLYVGTPQSNFYFTHNVDNEQADIQQEIRDLPDKEKPSHCPIILHRFLACYRKWKGSVDEIDLRGILVYDPDEVEYPYTANDLEMPLNENGLPLELYPGWEQRMGK